MSARIQYRRGTAAQWTAANPTLAVGEPGYETDTGLRKMGDGATAWTGLAYQASALDVASGAAKLGSDGTVGGPGGSALAGAIRVSTVDIDLCRPPYNCTPGADITTTLQTAINALVTAGSSTNFYFSQPGVYPINGAVQTGNVARSDKPATTATVTIASPAVVSKSGGALSTGDAFTLTTTGALPTGLDTSTVYYVLPTGFTGNTFQVATAPNGTAIVTTGSQSGTHTLTPVKVWAGQILLPSISWAGLEACVRFRGCAVPNIYADSNDYGTILSSNATSGSVFSVIAPGTGAYPGHSAITVAVEDLSVRVPGDPQCGVFDFANAWQWSAERVRVFGASRTAANLTGTKAVFASTADVIAGARVRDCVISYMPVVFKGLEQLILHGDVFLTNCNTVFRGGNSSSCYMDRVYAMGCQTIFQPDANMVVNGELGLEPTGQTAWLFANDPGNQLSGNLRVFLSGVTALTPKSLPTIAGGGPGVLTGSRLNIVTTNGVGTGTLNSHPVDRFLRKLPAPAPPAGYPGLTSDTWHASRITGGTFNLDTAAGKLTLNTGPGYLYWPVKNGANGGESRTITVPITGGSNADLAVVAQVPNGGTNGGKNIQAKVHSGLVTLYINNVSRGTTPAASFPNSTTHTVTLSITVQYGTATRARVAVDGVQTIDYRLTAAEQALFTPGINFPYLEDGLQISTDTTSTVNSFIVQPLQDDALVYSGTATLVAGTVDVANTNVTANTIVRLNRQAAGGTLGVLSVALSAGTKFTINSNNAADTSVIYYEVVSY